MAIQDYVARTEAAGNSYLAQRQQFLFSDGIDEDNEESNASIAQEEYEEYGDEEVEDAEEQRVEAEGGGEEEESVDAPGSRMETMEDVTMQVQSREMVSSNYEDEAAVASEEEEEEATEEGEREESVYDIGSRMETMEDVTMEVQTGGFVSSSPNCKSVKLGTSDILDCPTCYEPLRSPIFQCNNGHLACSSCCSKLLRRCSFCRSDIGDIRCRAMEKIIEATIVPCPNAIYGCKQTTTYGSNQLSHEKMCIFMPCSCPSPNCNYIGSYSDLKRHARVAHSWYKNNYKFIPLVFDEPVIFGLNLGGKKMTIFQEEDEGDLIVVQASKESNGMYVNVSCIAPSNPGVSNLSCSLAKLGDFGTLRLGLMVKKIQKVREEEVPQDSFMLIPSYMLSNENSKMQICIGREFKYFHI